MLLQYILVKKCGVSRFPQCRMLLFESFQNGFHNCLTQEFRFIFYPIPVTIDSKSSHFPVIEHQGKTICTP
jgi:7-cyano-7-deazaguanine synthase in queuosine biosynthesis